MNKEILLSGVSDDWLDLLDVPELDEVLEQLNDLDGKSFTPPKNKIFEFARLTNLSKIKVVILGQDPYPKAGEAHGLAFSSLISVPASLKNIYKCLLYHGLIDAIPTTGDLSYWAGQGVLLLNCSLTTIIGKSNEHAGYWENYTDKLISNISNLVSKERPIIFILWGNPSKKKVSYINNKCHVLEWAHPSPLNTGRYPFTTCTNFVEANKLLMKYGKDTINWNISPPLNEVEERFGVNTTVVFVDGSANPNKTCPAAIGSYGACFVLGPFKDVILYGNIDNKTHYANNQRAEGMAILKVLEYLEKNSSKWTDCVIVSDSEFWIKMFTEYMPAWNRNNVQFEDKKNPDITVKTWAIYNTLMYLGDKTIEFRHIKSHNKDGWANMPEDSYEYFCYYQNDYVDKLAKHARLNLEPGTDLESVVDYEN